MCVWVCLLLAALLFLVLYAACMHVMPARQVWFLWREAAGMGAALEDARTAHSIVAALCRDQGFPLPFFK